MVIDQAVIHFFQQCGYFDLQGKLKYAETVTEGFDKMFDAFMLFKGENLGKAVVKVYRDDQLLVPWSFVSSFNNNYYYFYLHVHYAEEKRKNLHKGNSSCSEVLI